MRLKELDALLSLFSSLLPLSSSRLTAVILVALSPSSTLSSLLSRTSHPSRSSCSSLFFSSLPSFPHPSLAHTHTYHTHTHQTHTHTHSSFQRCCTAAGPRSPCASLRSPPPLPPLLFSNVLSSATLGRLTNAEGLGAHQLCERCALCLSRGHGFRPEKRGEERRRKKGKATNERTVGALARDALLMCLRVCVKGARVLSRVYKCVCVCVCV